MNQGYALAALDLFAALVDGSVQRSAEGVIHVAERGDPRQSPIAGPEL